MGNLPPAYNADMLRQLFEPHAKVVHSAVPTEQGTGISRGFGFVHIPDAAQVRGDRQQVRLWLNSTRGGEEGRDEIGDLAAEAAWAWLRQLMHAAPQLCCSFALCVLPHVVAGQV